MKKIRYSIVAMVKCPNCGAKLTGGQTRCPKCGMILPRI